MDRLTMLFERAKDIYEAEGLISLVRRVFPFLIGHLVKYRTYYLYEHMLKDLNEADFMPRIHGLTFKIVSTNQQADELARCGLDFRPYVMGARQKLNKGAIAFCFFADRELAHIGWAAVSQEAQKSLGEVPIQVDFASGEAYTGGTVTFPKYGGKGLMGYSYFKRLQFLREKGITTSRNAVVVSNIASHRALAKLSPRVYAKACYLKVMWWTFWKETPLAYFMSR